MKFVSHALGLAASAVVLAATASGQTCLGRPYFTTGPIQLGLTGDVGNHASSIGGEVGLGRDRSVFGQARAGYENGESLGFGSNDPSGATLGGTLGYQISAGSKKHAQICPYVSGERAFLDYAGGADLDRSVFQLGGSVGFVLPSNSGFHLVPFGGLAFAQMGRTFTAANGAKTELATDTYTPLTLGLGFHFENSFMFTTAITVPIDLGGGDPSLGIRMVVPVGRRK